MKKTYTIPVVLDSEGGYYANVYVDSQMLRNCSEEAIRDSLDNDAEHSGAGGLKKIVYVTFEATPPDVIPAEDVLGVAVYGRPVGPSPA